MLEALDGRAEVDAEDVVLCSDEEDGGEGVGEGGVPWVCEVAVPDKDDVGDGELLGEEEGDPAAEVEQGVGEDRAEVGGELGVLSSYECEDAAVRRGEGGVCGVGGVGLVT